MDNTKTVSQNRISSLILAAEFAALLAIFSQIAIPLPFSPIPMTGQTLAIGLFATVASTRISGSAVGVYLLMGAIGLPVFAKGGAGFTALFGPSGGYLFGFLVYAIIVGLLMKISTKWWNIALSNFVAAIVQLFIGALWFAVWNNFALSAVIKPAMLVFIPIAIVKIIIIVFVTNIIIKRFGIFGAK